MNQLHIEEFILEDFEQNEVDNAKTTEPKEQKHTDTIQEMPDVNQIYQKAYNEGYEKAKAEMANIFNQQYENLKKEYELKLSQLNSEVEKNIQIFNEKLNELKNNVSQIENEIVNISIDIAQKIIEKEIQNPQIVKNLIKNALSFAKSSKVKIKLNPEQAKLIKDEFSNIEIISDPNLPSGSILIEEDSNIIDASINTKLEELKRNLINES